MCLIIVLHLFHVSFFSVKTRLFYVTYISSIKNFNLYKFHVMHHLSSNFWSVTPTFQFDRTRPLLRFHRTIVCANRVKQDMHSTVLYKWLFFCSLFEISRKLLCIVFYKELNSLVKVSITVIKLELVEF